MPHDGFSAATRPRIGISACLLGERVRHDGAHRRQDDLVAALASRVTWVAVCPEAAIGLGVPRPPIRLEAHAGGVRLVGVTTRVDHTAALDAWAASWLDVEAARGLDGFVLKVRSPSCGPERTVAVFSTASDGVVGEGAGRFAQAIVERRPDLPVAGEEDLLGPAAREAFLAQVRAHARGRAEGGR